jgi:hemerythrin
MDRQHKHLVELINRMNEAVQFSKENPAILMEVLTELMQCTKNHFEEEEKLMREVGFALLDAHHEVHQKLLRTVTDVMEKVKSGKLSASINTANFLQIWLKKHLVGYDQQYARHIASLKTAETEK